MITVVIPTHPGRDAELDRALASVWAQSPKPESVVAEYDYDREGAAATRNRALAKVDTPWVAFLDSDDEFKPGHLKACLRHAGLTGADVVYPWFDGPDEIGCFGMSFDPAALRTRNYIPVTTLCRTWMVNEVGGFEDHPDENGDPCEDWGLWLKLLDAGATFSHLPLRTWIFHPGGTRGRAAAA